MAACTLIRPGPTVAQGSLEDRLAFGDHRPRPPVGDPRPPQPAPARQDRRCAPPGRRRSAASSASSPIASGSPEQDPAIPRAPRKWRSRVQVEPRTPGIAAGSRHVAPRWTPGGPGAQSTAPSRCGSSPERRNPEGDASITDLGLGAHEAFGHGRLGNQEGRPICPVDRPQTERRVRATRAETSSAGWQHNMRLRVSAARGEASCPVPDSLASRIEAASLVPRMASRLRRSRALWRATPMSQPRALSGTPVDGHCSSAATHASCTASSAAPRSPVRRHTVPTAAHQCLRISSSSAALTPASAPPRSGGPPPRRPRPQG